MLIILSYDEEADSLPKADAPLSAYWTTHRNGGSAYSRTGLIFVERAFSPSLSKSLAD